MYAVRDPDNKENSQSQKSILLPKIVARNKERICFTKNDKERSRLGPYHEREMRNEINPSVRKTPNEVITKGPF